MMVDKWQCAGCRKSYYSSESDEAAEDCADQFFCAECDSAQNDPYCSDCVLYFETADIAICQSCLDEAMADCVNVKGKVVERIVEKPVYVETPQHESESIEDFEKRIMGG
jgi:hypothetical protein